MGTFGLCCGLPVLLSLGFLGLSAGISLGSWVRPNEGILR